MTYSSDTKTVIVGGTSGIGGALAQALKDRPGSVEIASRRTGLDITDEASVNAYFERIGAVDHVVVTAGSSAPGGGATAVSLDEAQAAFNTKFWGSVRIARAAARHLKPGGTITLTSGFLSRKTVPGTFVKTAMNAALEVTAKQLARELAPIRVNVVSPGLTDTEAYAGMADDNRRAMLDSAAGHLPAGRYGRAEDLATGYIFLIDNPFITGAVIDIDGGSLIN